MFPRTRSSSCRSRNKKPSIAPRSRARGEGMALLILMMMVTLLLVSLTVALPNLYTAGQREREEELIFRGNEYARAIMLYQRQFRHFPTSVEDLTKRTNGMRFLRRAYRDPMSRNGKWRFIHADATGTLLDSKTLGPASRPPPGNPQQSMPGTPAQAAAEPSTSAPKEMLGAFIAGVASSSRRNSIRVWNNHTRYDEWEFLGIAAAAPGSVPAQQPTPTGATPQPQPPMSPPAGNQPPPM